MIVEVKLKRLQVKAILAEHAAKLFGVAGLVATTVEMRNYSDEVTVTFKDQTEIDTELKAKEADRIRLAKQDAERAETVVPKQAEAVVEAAPAVDDF